jgi:two-component system sensor histidine kinase CreC
MRERLRAVRGARIFAIAILVYLAVIGLLLWRVAGELDPRYRESAEDALVDTANLLATLLERTAYQGVIQTDELSRTLEHLADRDVDAQIYGIPKHAVELHVYVTDRSGIVLFDSTGRDLGADYSGWRDVALTLQGGYGARTTLADRTDPHSAVMYVAAPIREYEADGSGRIIGVVAVGKPFATFSPFIVNARQRLVLFGAISTGAFGLLLIASTIWLVRPFGLAHELWRALVATGTRSPRQVGRLMRQALRNTFADLRDALAGRSYVDEYVQTLTHELKSPLAAIRGAAELLEEPMAEAARARFTHNIVEQAARAQDLIDRMLELSALERRSTLDRIEPVALDALAEAVRDELAALAAQRRVGVNLALAPGAVAAGDAFLLHRALSNLARNALEFSPPGAAIEIASHAGVNQVELSVRDRGSGLPAFANERVFERFFSLARPDTGRKGTGLGLAFVREIAALHGGKARLENRAGGGAEATLILPRAAAA